MDQKLGQQEKKTLLDLARQTLNQYVQSRKTILNKNLSKELMGPSAAFVMLYDGTELRGISGTFEQTKPLAHIIQTLVIEAAVSDPAHPPVQRGEMDRIKIKVVVLSNFKRFKDLEQIQLGTHGLYFTQNNKRSYLFSQAAIENKWNVDQFLSALCENAGLHRHAWQDKQSVVWTFEEECFSE